MNTIRIVSRACCAAVVAIMIAGCEGKSSSTGEGDGNIKVPVQTSAMHLNMEVTYENWDPVRVYAKLSDGTTTDNQIALDGGDYLRACVGLTCRDFEVLHGMWGNITMYKADLPYFPDTPYVVSLVRPSGRVSAPNSRVTLPPRFDVVQPARDQLTVDGDSITISWQPVSTVDQSIVSANTLCTYADSSSRSDGPNQVVDHAHVGVAYFAMDDLLAPLRIPQPPSNSQSPISYCNVLLHVSQDRTGTVDSAWGGGAATSRSTAFGAYLRYEPTN